MTSVWCYDCQTEVHITDECVTNGNHSIRTPDDLRLERKEREVTRA